jgi:hypothetical protein
LLALCRGGREVLGHLKTPVERTALAGVVRRT